MIGRSDNAAAAELRNRLGSGPIERLARRSGMKDFRYGTATLEGVAERLLNGLPRSIRR